MLVPLAQCGLINYHVDPGSQPLMGYNSREKLSYPVLLHNTHSSASTQHTQPSTAPAQGCCKVQLIVLAGWLSCRCVLSASAASVSDSALSQLYSFPSASPPTRSSALAAAAAAEGSSSSAAVAEEASKVARTASTASPSPVPASVPTASFGAALPASFRRVLVGPLVSQELLADSARYRQPVGSSPACSSCGSETALEGVRFVSRQEPSLVLCADCFGRGRFPPLLVADDFLRDTAATSAAFSHISPAAAAPVPSSIAFGAASASTTINTAQPAVTAASASSAAGAGEWTPEETLRLLDALSQHGEDWDAVADMVGTKTKDESDNAAQHPRIHNTAHSHNHRTHTRPHRQRPHRLILPTPLCLCLSVSLSVCAGRVPPSPHLTSRHLTSPPLPSHRCCIHFLALPIEDPFLDHFANIGNTASNATIPSTTSPTSASVSSVPSGRAVPPPPPRSAAPSVALPFADTGNPILAQVAFLASTVSPAVAAAAAQAAIQYYAHSSDGEAREAATNGQNEQQQQQQADTTATAMDTGSDAEGDTTKLETGEAIVTTDGLPNNGRVAEIVSQSASHIQAANLQSAMIHLRPQCTFIAR